MKIIGIMLIIIDFIVGIIYTVPKTLDKENSLKTLEYFRQQIRDGKEIDFLEYFYATTFQEKYPLCEKSYCTQLSPDMVSYKNISVKGYFILLPKEEYFLCTETGDPTCFPPSTGVYNVYFLINTGDTLGLLKEKLARIGCYDEKNHTILYESQSIDWSTRTYQRIISQFSTKKTNEILENAITKKPIDIILYVPEYEGIIQDGRKCLNQYDFEGDNFPLASP